MFKLLYKFIDNIKFALAFRGVSIFTQNQIKFAQSSEIIRKFSQLTIQQAKVELPLSSVNRTSALTQPLISQTFLNQQRNFTKYSLNKGKRKTANDIVS